MKLFNALSLSAALSLLCSTAVNAQATQDIDANIRATVTSKLNLPVEAVAESGVDGLYTVMTPRGVLYVSGDGKHLLQGKLYEVGTRPIDKTESFLNQYRAQHVQDFGPEVIEFKADNEQHVIHVFTDTSCGYCRKLHNDIAGYNDLGITVRYLAFPRSGVQGSTFESMKSIWCAEDKQSALTAGKNGETVAVAACDTDITKHYEFGRKVGVTGTPAIVLEDGTMIPGYQPPNQLIQILARG